MNANRPSLIEIEQDDSGEWQFDGSVLTEFGPGLIGRESDLYISKIQRPDLTIIIKKWVGEVFADNLVLKGLKINDPNDENNRLTLTGSNCFDSIEMNAGSLVLEESGEINIRKEIFIIKGVRALINWGRIRARNFQIEDCFKIQNEGSIMIEEGNLINDEKKFINIFVEQNGTLEVEREIRGKVAILKIDGKFESRSSDSASPLNVDSLEINGAFTHRSLLKVRTILCSSDLIHLADLHSTENFEIKDQTKLKAKNITADVLFCNEGELAIEENMIINYGGFHIRNSGTITASVIKVASDSKEKNPGIMFKNDGQLIALNFLAPKICLKNKISLKVTGTFECGEILNYGTLWVDGKAEIKNLNILEGKVKIKGDSKILTLIQRYSTLVKIEDGNHYIETYLQGAKLKVVAEQRANVVVKELIFKDDEVMELIFFKGVVNFWITKEQLDIYKFIQKTGCINKGDGENRSLQALESVCSLYADIDSIPVFFNRIHNLNKNHDNDPAVGNHYILLIGPFSSSEYEPFYLLNELAVQETAVALISPLYCFVGKIEINRDLYLLFYSGLERNKCFKTCAKNCNGAHYGQNVSFVNLGKINGLNIRIDCQGSFINGNPVNQSPNEKKLVNSIICRNLSINVEDSMSNKNGSIDVLNELIINCGNNFTMGGAGLPNTYKNFNYGISSQGPLQITSKIVKVYLQSIYTMNECHIKAQKELEFFNNYLRVEYRLFISSGKVSLSQTGLIQVIGQSAKFEIDTGTLLVRNYNIDVDSELWINREIFGDLSRLKSLTFEFTSSNVKCGKDIFITIPEGKVISNQSSQQACNEICSISQNLTLVGNNSLGNSNPELVPLEEIERRVQQYHPKICGYDALSFFLRVLRSLRVTHSDIRNIEILDFEFEKPQLELLRLENKLQQIKYLEITKDNVFEKYVWYIPGRGQNFNLNANNLTLRADEMRNAGAAIIANDSIKIFANNFVNSHTIRRHYFNDQGPDYFYEYVSSHAEVKAGDSVEIEAKYMTNYGFDVAGKSISIDADKIRDMPAKTSFSKQSVEDGAKVTREGFGVVPSTYKAKEGLTIKAKTIDREGVICDAGTIRVMAERITDSAAMVFFKNKIEKGKNNTINEEGERVIPAVFRAKEGLYVCCIGDAEFYSVEFHASGASFKSEKGNIKMNEIPEWKKTEIKEIRRRRRLFFTSKRVTNTQKYEEHSKGCAFDIKGFLEMVADKEIVFEDPTIRAMQTCLNAHTVNISPGYEIKKEMTVKKKTNILWQKMETYREEKLTYRAFDVATKLSVKAKKVILNISAKDQNSCFKDLIATLQLDKDVIFEVSYLEDKEIVERHKVQGPSFFLGAVVGIAAAAIGGWVAGKFLTACGLSTKTLLAGAIQKGFKVVFAQMALGMLNNGGKIEAAFQALKSPGTVASLACIFTDLLVPKEVPFSKFITSAKNIMIKGALTKDFKGALFGELRGLAVDKISEKLNGEIGKLKVSMDRDFGQNLKFLSEIIHKLVLHPISGGIQGFILGGKEGTYAGLVGSLGETIFEALLAMNEKAMIEDFLKNHIDKIQDENEINAYREKFMEDQLELTKNITTIFAALFGIKNYDIAGTVAENAVRKNYMTLGRMFLSALGGTIVEGPSIAQLGLALLFLLSMYQATTKSQSISEKARDRLKNGEFYLYSGKETFLCNQLPDPVDYNHLDDEKVYEISIKVIDYKGLPVMKPIYTGKTKDLFHRMGFHRVLLKYGKDYIAYRVVYDKLSKDQVRHAEQANIDLNNTKLFGENKINSIKPAKQDKTLMERFQQQNIDNLNKFCKKEEIPVEYNKIIDSIVELMARLNG